MRVRDFGPYTCLAGALTAGIPYLTLPDDERLVWVPQERREEHHHVPEPFYSSVVAASNVTAPTSGYSDNASPYPFAVESGTRRVFTVVTSGGVYRSHLDER